MFDWKMSFTQGLMTFFGAMGLVYLHRIDRRLIEILGEAPPKQLTTGRYLEGASLN